MARKPRLHVPGGIYHVLLRGNGGQDIFFDKGDRSRFLLLLQEGTERFSYRLHAFCFMTNHIHLVIQVSDIPLSKIIQNVSFRYTKYINKKKKRIGHLFQGRYKAILIDEDSYLLELVRYIHNNPVRGGLVNDPIDYPWSSHSAYLGKSEIPFLTTSLVLGQFGDKLPVACKNYLDFVNKGMSEDHREEFYAGQVDSRMLGDENFVDNILNRKPVKKRPQLNEIVTYVCKKYEMYENKLSQPSRRRDYAEIRGIIAWLALKLQAAPLTEVGERYNRDIATISRAARRVEEKMALKDFKKDIIGYLKDLGEGSK